MQSKRLVTGGIALFRLPGGALAEEPGDVSSHLAGRETDSLSAICQAEAARNSRTPW